jgi:hypothetical protein
LPKSRGKVFAESLINYEVSRTDEIGALARVVERVGASIRYAMERLKKAKSTPEKASSWFLSGNDCVMGI